MFESVLVICVGNICRSPIGERLLKMSLPNLRVGSAGLQALVGEAADPHAAAAAERRGIDVSGHVARKFTADLGRSHDLLLVMEQSHRNDIARQFPYLSGRTMLFGQWLHGTPDIPDPYRRPAAVHDETVALLSEGANAWAQRLAQKQLFQNY